MNGANGKKEKSLTNYRGAKNPPGAIKFKRSILSLFLITSFLLAIGTASATFKIQGELPQIGGPFWIKAFDRPSTCSSSDYNAISENKSGSGSYTGREADYSMTIPDSMADLYVYYCTTAAGGLKAYYHPTILPTDDVQYNLGKVEGSSLHPDFNTEYKAIVCNGSTKISSETANLDGSNNYTQYYVADYNSYQYVTVMLDSAPTAACTLDASVGAAKDINLLSASENYGISVTFAPRVKATGALHSDLANGTIDLNSSTNNISIGKLKLGAVGGTQDYNIYYDNENPGGGTITMTLNKLGSAGETISFLPLGFTVWDANIRLSANLPTTITKVGTTIDTGIDVNVDVSSATFSMYIPDANTPTLTYTNSEGTVLYTYTYSPAVDTSDATKDISMISGEAHSTLENAPAAAIEVFTDPICSSTGVTNPEGDPNYRNNISGTDYNIYFQGNDGTYYLKTWYNDGSNDFNSCGNAVTVASQEGTQNLSVQLSGKTPAGLFTSATIDWNKDEGTDVNTTTFPGGNYYMFTQSDSAVRIKFFSDGNVVDLNVDKDLSSDLELNVGNIAGNVLAAAGDGDTSEQLDIYSDAECTTQVSTEYEKPTNADGSADYNQFYEATLGDANYYVYLRAHILGYDYNSCIRFDGGIGQEDTLNIDGNLFGEYPAGVTRIAIDFNSKGAYDVIGDSNAGSAPDINYFVLFPTSYYVAAQGADINVLGYGSISDNNVLLSKSVALDGNRDFNIGMISGTAHAELREDGGSDNIKVYTAGSTSGNGSCSGTELSSEDITISGSYVQYYESIINDQNLFIQVIDANTNAGTANTCINTRKIDTPGDANTFNLDKKLFGAVPSDITKVQVSLNDDGDYDLNGTVSSDHNYAMYHPTGNANADINFLSASGIELRFNSDKDLRDNLQINIGKVTGSVHADAQSGDDYITVHTTATCTDKISTEDEAPTSSSYTQYFEDDGSGTYYVELGKDNYDYNSCFQGGFTLSNQEASGIDFDRKISGTIPSRESDARTYFDVNSVGANIDGSAGDDYLATSNQDAAYELYVDADDAGASDAVSFYSTYTGADTLYSKTVDLSSDTVINLAYVFGETHAALDGTNDIIGVYSEQACSTQLNSVTAHPSTGSTNADYNIYFEPVEGQTTYFLKITDSNLDYSTNFISYHQITVPDDSNIAQVDLSGRLDGTVVEQYDGSTPIQDANVELLHDNGTDWNAYTFTNSDGNYALYSSTSGTYDLRYTKSGHITRDWTTNAGEMNDVSLSATVDTNLGSGVIVTVVDDLNNSIYITDANVTLYTSIDPDTQLTGCLHPSGNCSMVGNNTAGQGQNGQYYFSGFDFDTSDDGLYIRVEKAGWQTVTNPPSGEAGHPVTASSQWTITIPIRDTVPGQVSLKTPLTNTYTSSQTPTLQWYDYSVDETGYVIQISSSEDFSSIHEQASTGKDTTTYTISISNALSYNTTYYWRVRADDNAGAGAWSDIWYFNVDNAGPSQPTVLINSGATYTNSREVTVTVQGHDFNHCRLSNDGIAWDGWYDFNGDDANYSFALPAGDGLKTVYVNCKNEAGLETSNSNTITLDTTSPTTTVSLAGGAAYTNSVNITMNYGSPDGATCYYSDNNGVDWNALGNCTGTQGIILSGEDGEKTISFKSVDSAGNTGYAYASIILDSTPPSDPVPESPVMPTTVFTGTTATWEWTGSTDATSGVKHYNIIIFKNENYFKDVNVYPETFLTLSNLDEGDYTIMVTAVDNAGNSSSPAGFGKIVVDVTKPSATFTSPTRTADTNDLQPDFNFSLSDNTLIIECIVTPYINGMAQSSVRTRPSYGAHGYTCGYTFSARSEGDSVQIGVVVVDDANNESHSVLSPVLTVDTTAPVVTISSPTTSSTLGDTTPTVTFKAASGKTTNDVNLGSILVQRNNENVTQSFNTTNCYLDGNAWNCSFDIPAASAFTNGSTGNSILIRVFDNAGNYTDATVTDLNVDTTDYITLNSITAVSTLGQADDTNEHAWKWNFNVTFGVGSLGDDKNKLRFKLANWTSSTTTTTLYVDGNAEMIYDANVYDATLGWHRATKVYNLKTTYDETQTVYPLWDHNPATAAIDANFYIQQRIPSSIASGQYSSSYRIKTYSS